MDTENQEIIKKVQANPAFHEMVRKKSLLSWGLASLIIICYFGFILTLAFSPETLGHPLTASSVTTVGVPVGVFIIVFSFILTGIYVRKANGVFHDLTEQIVKEAQK
jgi:uncharacterized membrane protein (DUF485 family)